MDGDAVVLYQKIHEKQLKRLKHPQIIAKTYKDRTFVLCFFVLRED